MSTNNHFRSISLPTTCHPISTQFDEQLSRLLSSKNTTTSCSSLAQSLISLVGLYDCVDELLLRPANQQTISKNTQEKWVDNILEGSLKLLDVCDVARDALFSMKECLQSVESKLRRSNNTDISEYLNSRNKVKKGIRQCLKNMKKNVDRIETSSSLDSVFMNVDIVTTDVLKVLLSHIAGVKSEWSKGNMSLVVRLVRQFSDMDNKAGGCSEFRGVDAQLRDLICQKKSGMNAIQQVEKVRGRVMKLESEVEELCEALECLFRYLVKTRATLLNLLSN